MRITTCPIFHLLLKSRKEQGIDIGSMNEKLLQKVEEFTLYLINQNKRLDAQERKIDLQQKEIETLRKK